jgi:hypothetical protein
MQKNLKKAKALKPIEKTISSKILRIELKKPMEMANKMITLPATTDY